jgi:hypothetical protein
MLSKFLGYMLLFVGVEVRTLSMDKARMLMCRRGVDFSFDGL